MPTDGHELAEQLQRILLPAELPDIPGWAAATLYQPAGETVLVGGDFYDWFTLPNGKVVFLLGDVSGKGPQAGALGMSIRKAIKGIAWVTGDALTALPVLEQALADEFGSAFATMCLFELEPASGDVRLVLAGHPRPFLGRHGVFREVTAPPNAIVGPRLARRGTTTTSPWPPVTACSRSATASPTHGCPTAATSGKPPPNPAGTATRWNVELRNAAHDRPTGA